MLRFSYGEKNLNVAFCILTKYRENNNCAGDNKRLLVTIIQSTTLFSHLGQSCETLYTSEGTIKHTEVMASEEHKYVSNEF